MALKFVQQGEFECSLACIAMVSGITIEAVKSCAPEFIPDAGMHTKGLVAVLERIGLIPIRYFDERLIKGRIYIVSAPSLNTLGGSHNVVVDWSEGSTGIVLDPNRGLQGKKWYGGADGYPLTSWYDIVEVIGSLDVDTNSWTGESTWVS